MPFDILTFGEALVEIVRPGIDQPLDAPGTFEGPFPSGAPFIFTVQAARLGANAACIGCVGDDAFGYCQLDQLRADGVTTDVVRVLPDYTTGVAFVAYAGDGSRDFLFHMRQAASGQLSPDLLDESWFEGLRLLHISGSTLAMHDDALALGHKALEMALAAGAKISFDLNIRPQLLSFERARDIYAPFLDSADVILATIEEALRLTGASNLQIAAEALLDGRAGRIVIIHNGARGCTVHKASGVEFAQPFEVEEIDPTGAGDCFDAGFLVRWLEGAAPVEAASFANACGALAVTARGPMAGAKARSEVETVLKRGEI
ncbi:MAG: sugar kinase [Anaerolineae bacterium]|nr:sugar kinase [Anaerolineae bacterium]